MTSNRSRANRSVGNKLNNLDSRVSKNEKGTNNPHLSPDVIEQQHLVDGAVVESKITDRAITETKIARGAVGTEHLGIVNTLTADSGLTLKPGPDGGFIVIDGPEYVAPAPGSGDLYALAFNELNQVVVSTTGVGGGDGIAAMPAGSIQPWPTNVAPDGWLLCNGSAVSRTDYPYLFNTLVPSLGTVTVTIASPGVFTLANHGLTVGDGVFLTTTGALPTGFSANQMYYVQSVPTSSTFTLTGLRTNTVTGYSLGSPNATSGTQSGTHTLWSCRFGNGDGTTTFNVPDLRGRVVVGRDSAQTEFDSLGEIGGAKTHTLTESEIPSHTHSGTTTNTGSSHRHWISGAAYDDGNMSTSGTANTQDYGLAADAGSYSQSDTDKIYGRFSSFNGSLHTHTFTSSSQSGTPGGAHNNLQPYMALNYIIKHMQADGMQGPQGIQGEPGDAATVTVGSTTTGAPGSVATVSNSGTSSAAVLNFTIPRGNTGATGATGPQGPSGTVTVGSTSTGIEGSEAQVTNSGTSTNAILEFVIPRGNAATITAGETTNPDFGTPASVTNVGDSSAAIFDFVIPKGRAATLDVGSTTTVSEDNDALVTNSGTTSDAIFDFEIPRGDTGNPAGVKYAFSITTTDADPGNGIIRLDSATPASISSVFLDNLDANGSDQTTWYQQWDDTTNVHSKGYIFIAEYRTNNVLVLRVTGNVTGASGYYKVPVTYVAGSIPTNAADIFVSFAQSGDQGVSVPAGGDTGQILAKDSNADYDFVWIDNYADWTSQVKHRVKAAESLTIGQAVYVSGADGTNMLVSKASNASEATSSKTMGLIMESLSVNGQGFVITEGLLSGLNTLGATQGDPVWLGTNGGLIFGLTNKPVAPAHLVFIGIVTRVNQNNGEIFVRVQNGFELRELHDVLITNPQNGQALTYDSATGLWKNSTPASTLDDLTDVTISDPEDKQVLKYDGATEQWINAVATGGVTVSDTAPVDPQPGDAWWDSTDGNMYVYYEDVDTTQWVQVKTQSIPSDFSGVELRVDAVETDVTALQTDVATLQSTQILTSNANTFTANQTFAVGGSVFNGSNGTLVTQTTDSGKVPLTVEGAVGQSVNLQEWVNSSFSVLSSVDQNGLVRQTNLPAFSIRGNGTQSMSGAATVVKLAYSVSVTLNNNGGHYSTANNRFTAPVAGLYYFHATACVMSDIGGPELLLYKNGAVYTDQFAIGYGATYNTFGNSAVMQLAANDFIEIYLRNNNGTSFSIDLGRSLFSGMKIG